MSMRKAAMQRSHRKSISEKDLKPTNLDGTYVKESATSPGKSKNKRSKNKKGKSRANSKKMVEKENNLPLAQSTMINDSKLDSIACSPESVTQKSNETLKVADNSDKEESTNTNNNTLGDKAENVVQNNKSTTNNTMKDKQIVKMSPQEAVDQVLEYKYKYERLCGIMEQFKEQHATLLTNFQTQMTANKEMKNKLTDDMYKLEAEKFNLQEQLEKSKSENDQLKERLGKKEKSGSEDDNKSNTSACKPDTSIASAPSEPQALCRTRRKSMLNENVSSIVKDDAERCAFYEDIILDQQEILDFYSLLCSTSICKQTEQPVAEEDDDVTPKEMKYSCKIQLKNHALDGYPFDFCLDYEKNEFEYTPSTAATEQQQHLPCNLQTIRTYNADQGCLFTRDLTAALDKADEKFENT